MIKTRLTIDKTDSGYVLNVDGGSIECGTTAEVMSRVGHEMGMPYGKAQRQLFERMEAAEKVTRDLEAENDALFRAKSEFEKENAALKAAIVRWFIRAYGGAANG